VLYDDETDTPAGFVYLVADESNCIYQEFDRMPPLGVREALRQGGEPVVP
jgi:hypothetical protein